MFISNKLLSNNETYIQFSYIWCLFDPQRHFLCNQCRPYSKHPFDTGAFVSPGVDWGGGGGERNLLNTSGLIHLYKVKQARHLLLSCKQTTL